VRAAQLHVRGDPMVWGIFGRRSNKGDLASRCREYLDKGPPKHMKDYVPNSLTEIIIAYGANGKGLDAELSEVAGIIVTEAISLHEFDDREIREYMLQGASLVREVLDTHGIRA